jgi:Mg2+ and Co2+ transporter CorA
MINRPLRVSHDTLGRVRFLESRFLPLRSILSSFEEVLEGLEGLGSTLVARRWVIRSTQLRSKSRLENLKRYSRTFVRSAMFLQDRSNNTATLLADTLAFRNQGVAQEQNGSMVVLTRSAVFITVITLIYLPWTLITGIFGMEFFELDQATGSLITSTQIWIYFVAAVGTTLFTVLLYFAMAGFPSFWRRNGSTVQQAQDEHVPQSLKRGCTDLEKNPRDFG